MIENVTSIRDIPLEGRSVLMRLDLNCPLHEGEVSSDARIRAALPTIEYALKQGARLAVASHLGRPKGKVRQELSLAPVGARLAELLGVDIILAQDCIGDDVKGGLYNLRSGGLLLLENLRFHGGETSNNSDFARRLAEPFDVFINDAFGACHRSHASVVGVSSYVEEFGAGFLLEKEIQGLSRVLTDTPQPFVAVVGGAKVSDKVGILESLLDRVKTICVGGAMAYTFLAAKGVDVGASRVEKAKVSVAAKILRSADVRGIQVLLPVDHVVSEEFSSDGPARIVDEEAIEAGWMGLDIGPKTRAAYAEVIASAKCLLWNGPMGVFEWEQFSEGTCAIARAAASSQAYTVVGGGDSVAALEKAGVVGQIDHVSTGGGASLEFLEHGKLPGLDIWGG